ncbi:MAG: hypothetical protein NTV57_02135 [Cyanobacteria bacterium]|nr:hypothetical protein [Cyanobacteriota bacterium]
MRRHLGLLILLLAASLTACQGPRPEGKPAIAPPTLQTREASRQQQARLCRHTSAIVSADLAALRHAERRLSRLKQQGQPATSPPPVWDAAWEERFSEQDQELDRQRYERELAIWQQQQQAQGQQAWERRHSLELAEAQSQLNARARSLRRRHHDLFTGATSIEVNPAVLAQIQRCPAAG